MSKKDQKTKRHGAHHQKSAKKTSHDSRRDSGQDSRWNSGRDSGRDLGQNTGRNPDHDSRQKPNREYRQKPPSKTGKNNDLWLFGKHPVLAALNNPKRAITRLLVTKRGADQYLAQFSEINQSVRPLNPEIILPDVLEKILPPDCLHQGIALQTYALPDVDLMDCCTIEGDGSHLLLILDQITDPHNVGAIMRSAAAFGARAIISTDRHAPPESGTLAKSASGALEVLPWIRVTNLSRTLDALAEMGYWRLGLDGSADLSIKQADFGKNIALVLGAEGKGLRKGTQTHCDALIKLPIRRTVESLNVSNAAAIALYEFSTG
ncbi:MAG: 23S rRNA (guanosine(2251)-2'-O)-methyltransferase RlmB [Emcibacter sp.]|nr:23S rRNA (guanosine(2251)-2'-O)-methyltransferase RlmB [Emcibacter sp.]